MPIPTPSSYAARTFLHPTLKVVAGLVPDRMACRLLGHEEVLVNEPRRKALRCTRCGYESPGWAVGGGRVLTRESDGTGKLRLTDIK